MHLYSYFFKSLNFSSISKQAISSPYSFVIHESSLRHPHCLSLLLLSFLPPPPLLQFSTSYSSSSVTRLAFPPSTTLPLTCRVLSFTPSHSLSCSSLLSPPPVPSALLHLPRILLPSVECFSFPSLPLTTRRLSPTPALLSPPVLPSSTFLSFPLKC